MKMVSGDRNAEEGRNGRRSRGPSPNGHLSDDSSSEDSDHEGGMRVGNDYQVPVPPFNPDLKPETRAEAMLVWAPHPDIPESKVDEYIHIAKEKHGYNVEQALGMLFWHKHNIDKSLTDLANFTPFPDEWTVEDKVLFEQAFSFHGKSFHRIRQMLPDKSIAQLVKYFYSWKKTRSRTSLMDRQAKKMVNSRDDSDDDLEGSDSDMDTKENGKEEGKISTPLRSGPSLLKKPELHPRNRHKKKPPRGMYLTQADLIALATGPPGQGEALLKTLDADLVQLKRSVQNNKQIISMFKQKTSAGITSLRFGEMNNRINARWTNEELLLAVQGVRKYGKDFKAIAEVIGNKTESHVRSFFVNYRRRYNLDEVLAEFEKENGAQTVKQEADEIVEKMEVEDKSDVTSKVTEEKAATNGIPAVPSSTVVPPPPLVKQPVPPPASVTPSTSSQAPGGRPVLLQQPPPPLIRPLAPKVTPPAVTSQ